MKSAFKSIAIALTLSFFCVPNGAAQDSNDTQLSSKIQKFSFLNMRAGEELVVKRSFRGCFSGGEDPTMTFTPQSVEIEGKGRFYIEDQEFLKLDRYWSLITKPDDFGGCTSITMYEVKLLRGGSTLAEGIVYDDYCGHFGSNEKKYLNLNQLETMNTTTSEIENLGY